MYASLGAEEWVLTQYDATTVEVGLTGLRAARLAFLSGDLPKVPPWYVITTQAFTDVLHASGLEPELGERLAAASRDAQPDWAAVARELQRLLAHLPVPAALLRAIDHTHDHVLGAQGWALLRLSPVHKLPARILAPRFAMLHRASLEDALRDAWQTAFSAPFLSWRHEQGLPLAAPGLAVLVQGAVDAVVAGILCTANPETGNPWQLHIRALFGSGNALNDPDSLPADRYVVDKQTMDVAATIAHKEVQLLLNESTHELVRVALPRALCEHSSLRVEEVELLARLGQLVEQHCGRPQRLQFARDWHDDLYILDAADQENITAPGPAAGNPRHWTTARLFAERTDTLTPLAFSFLRRLNQMGGGALAEAMKVSHDQIRALTGDLRELSGQVHGRLFANLDACRHLLEPCLAAGANALPLLHLLGIQATHLDLHHAAPASARPTTALQAILQGDRAQRGLGERMRRAEIRLADLAHQAARLPLVLLPPARLSELQHDLEECLRACWPSLLRGHYAYIETVTRLNETLAPAIGAVSWWPLAMATAPDLAVAPALTMVELASETRQSAEARQAVLDAPPEQLLANLRATPHAEHLHDRLARWVGEMEPVGTSGPGPGGAPWRLHPGHLMYLFQLATERQSHPWLDSEWLHQHRDRRRREAEAICAPHLHGGWLRQPEAVVCRHRLGTALALATRLSPANYALRQLLDVWRDLLDAIGHAMVGEQLFAQPDDIHYLTLHEIRGLFDGAAVAHDHHDLVEWRRREANDQRAILPPQPPFATYGILHPGNRPLSLPQLSPPKAGQGLPIEPGRVTGPLHWMTSPLDPPPPAGAILATEALHPGWAPVVPLACGLLLERADLFSSGPQFAHELGMPAIAGLTGLRLLAAGGRPVTMDGAAGTVEC